MKNKKKNAKKWKYKKAFFTVTDRPPITPPQITNRDKFPRIRGEDCDLIRIICGIFLSMNNLLHINLLITIN